MIPTRNCAGEFSKISAAKLRKLPVMFCSACVIDADSYAREHQRRNYPRVDFAAWSSCAPICLTKPEGQKYREPDSGHGRGGSRGRGWPHGRGVAIDPGKAVRAMARSDDERAQSLRDKGAEVVVGDLLDLDSMHRVIAGRDTMYFGMSVSDAYLAATVNTTAVARHHGVKAFMHGNIQRHLAARLLSRTLAHHKAYGASFV